MQRLVQRVYDTVRRPFAALRILKDQISAFLQPFYPTITTASVSSTPIQGQVDELYQASRAAQGGTGGTIDSKSADLFSTSHSEASSFLTKFASILAKPVSFKRYRIARNGSQAMDRRGALVKTMINEVIILSSLSNAGIVPFEGLYRADGTWERTYLAHAFDTTVREFLSARPDAERKRLMKDVADGLAYLHDDGVVYGGLSGATVLVDANTGRAHLSEFSQAILEGIHPTSTSYIQSMMEPASMVWLAPERLGGLFEDRCAGPTRASDVYALGCFAYLIFTGKDPFEELTNGPSNMVIFEIVSAVCNDNRRPTRPGTGDDAFVRYGLTDVIWVTILEACWVRDPHSQPDAAELARRLLGLGAVTDAGNV
ncbi:kinase-like protein [Coprinellus micaceus]|uniref:Kinase-like protein n=1 Tax=Coprinellus micaceus TaxID=71717 RepID=A0A4Y7TMD1_COPMI|nr:kinase-like protein [Coprinellus micaceus]